MSHVTGTKLGIHIFQLQVKKSMAVVCGDYIFYVMKI